MTNQPKTISEEEVTKLLQTGRELALGFMSHHVKTAKSEDELYNQIFILKVAAINILATIMYNDVRQGDHDPEKSLEDYKDYTAEEYDCMMSEGEIELIEVGGGSSDPKGDKGLH